MTAGSSPIDYPGERNEKSRHRNHWLRQHQPRLPEGGSALSDPRRQGSCRPAQRGGGTVRLKSPDPLAPPEIRFNFLRSEYDMRAVIKGVRIARNIARQNALQRLLVAETSPGSAVMTDEQSVESEQVDLALGIRDVTAEYSVTELAEKASSGLFGAKPEPAPPPRPARKTIGVRGLCHDRCIVPSPSPDSNFAKRHLTPSPRTRQQIKLSSAPAWSGHRSCASCPCLP